MNPTHVVAHRGLTNTIYFNVRDRDRKLQTITVDDIRCYIVDATTRRRVVSKLLEPDQLEKGIDRLVLREGDRQINLVPVYEGLLLDAITRTRFTGVSPCTWATRCNGLGFTLEIKQAY